MSLFGSAPTSKVEAEQDFSKRTLDTDVYGGAIKMAFKGQSAKGAHFITLLLKLDNGKEYNETIYVTNKDGKSTYTKDDKEFHLPGFLTMNTISLLTVGRGLHELTGDDIETRTVKLYDWDSKKELPQDVQAIIPMIGKRVLVAIQEEEYEKTKFNEATGKRDATGEYAIKNQLIKPYCPDTRKTAVEMRDDKEATQLDGWLATNKGKLKTVERAAAPANQTVAKAGQPSGLFGKPSA